MRNMLGKNKSMGQQYCVRAGSQYRFWVLEGVLGLKNMTQNCLTKFNTERLN
jgi:hypothetical protein